MPNTQINHQQNIKKWSWVILSIIFISLAQILLKFSMLSTIQLINSQLTPSLLTLVTTLINCLDILFDSLFSRLIDLTNSFTVINDSNWMTAVNLESIEIENKLAETRIDPHAITTMILLLIGLICYGASFYCWQRVLYYFPLSQAYSLIAITYVTVFYTVKLLSLYYPTIQESSSIHQHIAVFLIFIGVCLTQYKPSS